MLDRDRRAWVSKLAEERNAGAIETVRLHGGHRPRPGDLVITRDASSQGVRYTVGRLDRQPQLSCDSRDAALKIARGCARRDRVDVWERAAGTFTSVAPRVHRVEEGRLKEGR